MPSVGFKGRLCLSWHDGLAAALAVGATTGIEQARAVAGTQGAGAMTGIEGAAEVEARRRPLHDGAVWVLDGHPGSDLVWKAGLETLLCWCVP